MLTLEAKLADNCLHIGKSIKICTNNWVEWLWGEKKAYVENLYESFINFACLLLGRRDYKVDILEKGENWRYVECSNRNHFELVIRNKVVVFKFKEKVEISLDLESGKMQVSKNGFVSFEDDIVNEEVIRTINRCAKIYFADELDIFVKKRRLAGYYGEDDEVFYVEPLGCNCWATAMVGELPSKVVAEWLIGRLSEKEYIHPLGGDVYRYGLMKLSVKNGKFKWLILSDKGVKFVIDEDYAEIVYDDVAFKGKLSCSIEGYLMDEINKVAREIG